LSATKPALLPALFTGKCPNCRKGYVWQQKSVFPLKHLLQLKANCPVCGQRLVYERNNGAGINYALTIILFFLNLAWYWPVFGLSYDDNSVEYFLLTSIIIAILAQPWLMRLGRMIYLYLFIQFGKGAMR